MDPSFLKFKAEMEDPDWRLGRTPEFSHNLDTRIDGIGVFDVHMQVVAGKIEEVKIFSDALYPDVVDRMTAGLRGVEYGRGSIVAVLTKIKTEFEEPPKQAVIDAFSEWLSSNLDD